MADPYRSKTLAKIKAGHDREIHIRQVWVDGKELISIRDFFPGDKVDGRGITFPRHLFDQVLEELKDLAGYLGPGDKTAGVGQQRLF